MSRMTLSRSIEIMNPGDEWRSDSYSVFMQNDETLLLSDGDRPKMDRRILSEYGEIIPAEPEILDAVEYADKLFDEYVKTTDTARAWFIKIAKEMHQNGRLEMYLEIKALIGCISDNWASLTDDGYECILEYVRKLKPLNKDK